MVSYFEDKNIYPDTNTIFFQKEFIEEKIEDIPIDYLLDEQAKDKNKKRIQLLQKEYGNIFSIKISSLRKFIPSGKIHFTVVPTKFTIAIGFLIEIPQLTVDEEEIENPNQDIFGHIENGILWEDWNKKDIDIFFQEVFEKFMEMVETEVEKRKRQV